MTDAIPDSWIADLASEETQQRYIVNATAEEYLLPDEMLDMASEHARLELRDNALLTGEQRQALQELLVAIDGSGNFLDKYDRTNIGDLINKDEHWAAIRASAKAVVRAYNQI